MGVVYWMSLFHGSTGVWGMCVYAMLGVREGSGGGVGEDGGSCDAAWVACAKS